MPVFQTQDGKGNQLILAPFASEKELRRFVEGNLEQLLGVRFVATEFTTGEKHCGTVTTRAARP